MRFSVSLCLVSAFFAFFASADPSASEAAMIPPVALVSERSTSLFKRAPAPAPALTTTQQFEMLNYVNNLRAANGAPALRLDTRFINVAQSQANYQASRCQLTHGEPLGERVRRITGLSNLYLAENVAAGHQNVLAVFNGWKNSPGHFRNMVNPNYNVMGTGVTVNNGCYNYKIYWSQDFARVTTVSGVSPPTSSKPPTSSITSKPPTSPITSKPPVSSTTSRAATSPSSSPASSVKLGEWAFCTTSSQCLNNCCSKQYSNDGRLKCTPGSSQCV